MIKRKHLLFVIAFFVVGLIFGAFFDLEINQFLFHDRSLFGIICASIGTFPCYICFAFFAGYLFNMAKSFDKKWLKILVIVAALALTPYSIFLQAKEIISCNGWNIPDKWYIGYSIAGVVNCFFFYLGIKANKKYSNPKLLNFLILAFIPVLISLVPGVTILKDVFHRPRFRALMTNEGLDISIYHNFWEPFSNYKDYLPLALFGKEEFKSFPSGHTCCAACMMLFLVLLPYIHIFKKKDITLLFYIGFAWTLLIGFSRMSLGAHYLSDVCVGALLLLVFYFIINEIMIRKNIVKRIEE